MSLLLMTFMYMDRILPAWAHNLKTFGEAGVVKDAKNAKTGNRGTVMVFVGYPENCEHDSVCMWNPETNGT
jgi:hypothetical protein